MNKTKTKYTSVSFWANMAIFIAFAATMAINAIIDRDQIHETIGFLIETQGINNPGGATTMLEILILFFFVPFSVFLVRLNFSLTAFEVHPPYYKTYILELNKIFKFIEWVVRFAVYAILLVAVSNIFQPFASITEKLLGIFKINLSYYGMIETNSSYFEIYKGFVCIKDFVLFIIFYFLLLLFWDFLVYILNALSGNTLNFRVFFYRFLLNHIVGLSTWIILSLILFTKTGNHYMSNYYSVLPSALISLLLIYTFYVLKSIPSLVEEIKISYICHEFDS